MQLNSKKWLRHFFDSLDGLSAVYFFASNSPLISWARRMKLVMTLQG